MDLARKNVQILCLQELEWRAKSRVVPACLGTASVRQYGEGSMGGKGKVGCEKF